MTLEPPKGNLDTSKKYKAKINTEKGEIIIHLYSDQTPITCENFINLAKDEYYNGTTFHRVIPGFMVQGGDPDGTGSGGPGYQFEDEFVSSLKHDSEGILSMANAGPGTNGSQFFITLAPTPHLDGAHTVFGKVISGMDVVLKIRERDPMSDPNPGDLINSIEIE
jgi:cyclophilin family peptidyl-prolyl cis-trans isomerase|tara:strand:- start:849 stop:1343 length:495 start_codon:yes stop_codon:yes gene_type:complete